MHWCSITESCQRLTNISTFVKHCGFAGMKRVRNARSTWSDDEEDEPCTMTGRSIWSVNDQLPPFSTMLFVSNSNSFTLTAWGTTAPRYNVSANSDKWHVQLKGRRFFNFVCQWQSRQPIHCFKWAYNTVHWIRNLVYEIMTQFTSDCQTECKREPRIINLLNAGSQTTFQEWWFWHSL